MEQATWYDTTGKITGSKTSSSTIDMSTTRNTGEVLVSGMYDGEAYYINGTTPTLRVASPSTISGQTISNIPNPSTVDCGELGSYTVTDGEFEFTIDTVGEYNITVISVPHFDETLSVTIT